MTLRFLLFLISLPAIKKVMTELQHQELKTKILEERDTINKEIHDLQELCKPISPQCALGDLARFELMNDQLISEKTLHEAQIRKNKLNYALSKIDKEEFGLCIECKEEIAYERLLLLPESTYCIACAKSM